MTGVITSLPPLVEQPPGNNSNNPAGLPGVTYTAAIPNLPQTWTGLQTYTLGSMEFAGSTSGNTFLNATPIASGTVQLPAVGIGITDTLVGRNTTDTLTNKTLTNPVINGATIAGSSIAIHSTGTGNFDLSLINSENLTAARSLTLTVNDANRTLNMGGNISTAGALTTSGAFASTFTMTGTTTVTFPTAGTLATLAGTETLTNKTYDTAGTGNSFKINGVAITANTGTGSNVLAASPALTGVPTAPTAAVATNTTQLATTAFVIANGASAGVSSIAGNAGAFTLSTGITNSTNDIRLALNNATQQATPANPTGTASTTAVMMGLGATCKLTPVYGSRIKIEFHIQSSNSAVANGMTFQCRFGTGTAPVNGVAGTGTTVGAPLSFSSPGANFSATVAVGGIITGLTPGTAYWFDFSHFVTGGTSTFAGVDFNAMEF